MTEVIEALRALKRAEISPFVAAEEALDALVKPCPSCGGNGVIVPCSDGCDCHGAHAEDCDLCNGTGEVTLWDRLEAAETDAAALRLILKELLADNEVYWTTSAEQDAYAALTEIVQKSPRWQVLKEAWE